VVLWLVRFILRVVWCRCWCGVWVLFCECVGMVVFMFDVFGSLFAFGVLLLFLIWFTYNSVVLFVFDVSIVLLVFVVGELWCF